MGLLVTLIPSPTLITFIKHSPYFTKERNKPVSIKVFAGKERFNTNQAFVRQLRNRTKMFVLLSSPTAGL